MLLLFFLFFSSLAAVSSPSHHSCSPSPPCPPFSSPLPFPFSLSSGCGHPSFQIRCSANRSLLTINSISFDLLDLDLNSHSLHLSPSDYRRRHSYTDSDHPCPDPSSLPSSPLNLSASPFHLSKDSCSRLSYLRRSSPSPNCSACPGLSPYHHRLLSDPTVLLDGCRERGYTSKTRPGGGCDGDGEVTAGIVDFLRSGVSVKWDPSADIFFSKCDSCRNATPQGYCGFNESDNFKTFLCLVSTPTPTDNSRRRSHANHIVLLGTTLFAFTCLFALAVSAATIFRRNGSVGSSPADGNGEDSMVAFLRRHHLQLRSPVFGYDQLRASTNGFDPKRKIGDGGFGSVYLAQLEDGRVAAVKRLHRHHPANSNKSFCNEILILSSIHHPNLVRLHGYCCDPRGLLLVYDYVPNGTLADHLHGSRSHYKKATLTWPVRVDIALQTATALEYLHFSVKPPVVHRDITSSNIFVEKDMRIKVGDFGLSRLLSLPADSCPSSAARDGSSSSEYVWTGPQGTPGYLDPDYHHSFRLTEKSDVYSFGVVLLELITGMKAVDVRRDKREVGLADMVVSKIQVGELHKVVDPVLVRQGQGMGTVEAVAEIAFRCLAGDKDDRPDARELVEELKRIRGRTQDASSRSSTN